MNVATLEEALAEIQIPYGCTRHQTQLIEIWLPPVFETAGTREVSGVAGDAVHLNLALVSSSNLSGYPASVSVSHEPLTEKNLDKFLKAKLSNIPPDVNMVENEKVSINAVRACPPDVRKQDGE